MKSFDQMKIVLPFVVLLGILFATGCVQSPGGAPGTPTVTTAPATLTAVSTAVPLNTTLPMEDQKAEATSLAAKFAGEINGTLLGTAYREGPNSTAYIQVVDQLKSFQASDSRIAYVYTLEQVNGSVVFVADANYGLPDGSGYLAAYPDAPVELGEPVRSPIGAGPYTDSWGTFVSGYAPVTPGLNETRIIIAVDIRVEKP
ncbi:hypothetical protein J2741_000033 [Methanolinea mesophila]|uniref:hypothetical protein n=1 Tax=Methanolinea mesophila TaxID=547055 RepID=UPI001AEB2AE2|nr:hypothetical protein [Methanolinea mesophila]MBP1927486.1 hypothetical protein [Methanolinea mesophila]